MNKATLFPLLLCLFAMPAYAHAASQRQTCPEPIGDGWVGIYGSCEHVKDGVPVCTDFTGRAWLRVSAEARCAVAGGTFVKGACPSSSPRPLWSCLESLPALSGLAEVHRVYSPVSQEEFSSVCQAFNGQECDND